MDALRFPSTPLILAATVIPDRCNNSRRSSVSDASQTDRYIPPVGRYSQRASQAGADSSSSIRASRASSCFCSRCLAVADTARPAALVSSSNPLTASRSSASRESPGTQTRSRTARSPTSYRNASSAKVSSVSAGSIAVAPVLAPVVAIDVSSGGSPVVVQRQPQTRQTATPANGLASARRIPRRDSCTRSRAAWSRSHSSNVTNGSAT